MSTIIWKEIRENLKWAVLALLVSAVGMWMTLGSYTRPPMFPGQFDATHILSESFLVMTTVGGALFAGLIGFGQVIFEGRPDQWAFLVHRPIPRSQIFFGKAVAGLALYFLGFGIPLAAIVIWASLPGSSPAPFEWRMALPALADLLNGTVYYFAGMLTGLRQARWYGSRCLGILAALSATFGVIMFSNFWSAAVISVIAIGLSALAAWGSFLSCGRYSDQPALGRFALAAFFVPGTLTIVVAAGVFVGIAAAQTRRDYRKYTNYQIVKDGSVLKVTTVNSSVIKAVDLNGAPFQPPEGEGAGSLGQISQHFVPVASLKVSNRTQRHGGRSYRSWRTFFAPLPATSDALWCYSRTKDRILGYSVSNGRLVGSIGPNGFITGEIDGPDRFRPFDSGDWIYSVRSGDVLHFSDGIYRLALEERKVVNLFSPANGDPILGSTSIHAEGQWAFVAVATEGWIEVMTMNGKTVFRFENVHSDDEYGLAFVGKLPNLERFVFQFKASYYSPPDRRAMRQERLQVVSTDGTVMPESELPLLASQEVTLSKAESAISSIIPPVLMTPLWVASKDSRQFYASFVLLMSIAIGLICAACGVPMSRRSAFSSRRIIGWALFNGLFGLPGLLTFISVHEWPLRVPCASCGKQRVVTRETCEHCQADFPIPDRDGTEIFEVGVEGTSIKA